MRFPFSFEHDNNGGKWKKGLQLINDHQKPTKPQRSQTPFGLNLRLKFFAKLYEGLLLNRTRQNYWNQCVLIIFALGQRISAGKRSFLEVAKHCFCARLQKSKCKIIIRPFKLQTELPPIREVCFGNAHKRVEDTMIGTTIAANSTSVGWGKLSYSHVHLCSLFGPFAVTHWEGLLLSAYSSKPRNE